MKSTISSGYTLLESIVVISIVCTVVISIPPILHWLRQQGVRHAVEQLRADLQLTRVTAIRQRQKLAVRFNDPGLNQYSMAHKQYRDLAIYRGDVHFLKLGPDGKKMTTEVNFNRKGMSASAIPADIFVSDGNGLTTYRVRILLPGGISVYRWIDNHWR